ncbi:MAG TPA: NADH-quinone oxidoreductase subunit H, partial [bacterium]|nr:NADH-quinone oxidoreductase subunit H [bacterium]
MSAAEIAGYAILKIALIVAVVMGTVAFLPWLERKLIGHFQQRLGPYRVGPFGLLQPIADAIKLLLKEDILPHQADRVLYFAAPLLALTTAMLNLAVIPFGPAFKVLGRDAGNLQIADVNAGLLYMIGISS